ncbi:unnamed protein product [Paramecium pentaurelia]|uniref:Uncharacterized protein n=1 Tax=Paramecium pentaurelia TaxID=43138 RepID=A0A8S1YI53_9CILI|nr:unnamed protein product [Paramecium pentaurelia]
MIILFTFHQQGLQIFFNSLLIEIHFFFQLDLILKLVINSSRFSPPASSPLFSIAFGGIVERQTKSRKLFMEIPELTIKRSHVTSNMHFTNYKE